MPSAELKVQRVGIAKLKGAAHNPKYRTAKKNAHLGQLLRSIERIGLIYPILVDKATGIIIDGHRRVEVAKRLGWDEIPALYVSSDDPDGVYAEVNATAKQLSSGENLQVYLANEKAVTPWMRVHCQNWERRLGRPILVKLAKAGMSTRTLGVARKIATYTGSDTDAFVKAAALWLLRHRCRAHVDAFILTQQQPSKLYGAVKNNRPLQIVYTA